MYNGWKIKKQSIPWLQRGVVLSEESKFCRNLYFLALKSSPFFKVLFYFFSICVLFSSAELVFFKWCKKMYLGRVLYKTVVASLVYLDWKCTFPAVLDKTQKIHQNFTQGLLLPVLPTHCAGWPLTRRIYVWEGTSWVIRSVFLPS